MGMNAAKIGTKAFSERKDPNFITKDSGLKNLSATDEKKLGGKGLDEVLNKIADPNWVDPKKKLRAVGDQQMDKNAFMKLMLTQMKNQDPTSPIQAHEMAAQLAAFTSVEQLQNLNSTMQDMKKEQSPIVNFEALNFIGKSATGDSSEILRQKDDKAHLLKFTLAKDSASVNIKVSNSQGETVRTLEFKDLKAGGNSVSWSGQDERGVDMPPDNYRIAIEAKDQFDHKIMTETKFDGIITGVNFSAQGPILIIGNQSVALADVKKIVDPRIADPKSIESKVIDPKVVNSKPIESITTNSDLPKSNKQNQTNVMGTGNLQNVSMSRKVADKVEKGTGKEISI